MKTTGLIDSFDLDPQTGCWNWNRAKDKDGYGVMKFRGRQQAVHRVAAFLWMNLDKTPHLLVLHSCDNPSCFNPKHLFLGTNLDNMVDASKKKRLRGQSKTHCVNGHEYTPENTRIWKGTRKCKACHAAQEKAKYHERKLHVV